MNDILNYEALGDRDLKDHCKTYFARKKGRLHVENGTVCQDYCLVENIDNNIQVVCLADGHGGEAYTKSDKGSFYACEVFVNLIKTIISNCRAKKKDYDWTDVLKIPDFKRAYIQFWRQTVENDFRKENPETNYTSQSIIKKYGTTLLFTIYTEKHMVVGQLGDGAILMSNDYGHSQLFKRHGIKITSATSSLASNSAEYAFVIDVFETELFSSVLLSTDGIYDKLDTNNAFYLYEQELIDQIIKTDELKNPFIVQGIDVSEISKDDCTIALMKTRYKGSKLWNIDWSRRGFENVIFYRFTNGIAIFKALLNDKKVEIHLYSDLTEEISMDIKSAKLVQADQNIIINNNMMAYVYSIPDDFQRVADLIDSGEHLEKRYWFNENDIDEDEEVIGERKYSNEYWLKFYEQMLSLDDELMSIGLATRNYFNECLFVSGENEIIILSDALIKKREDVKGTAIKYLLSRFSIIGSLSCGNITIPLFETLSQGQSIMMLHVSSERKALCKVIYNAEKKILGLWNATDSVWNLENEKRKEIPVKGVMRLNRDHVFYVQPDELKLNEDAEFVDGYAKYKVNLLRR